MCVISRYILPAFTLQICLQMYVYRRAPSSLLPTQLTFLLVCFTYGFSVTRYIHLVMQYYLYNTYMYNTHTHNIFDATHNTWMVLIHAFMHLLRQGRWSWDEMSGWHMASSLPHPAGQQITRIHAPGTMGCIRHGLFGQQITWTHKLYQYVLQHTHVLLCVCIHATGRRNDGQHTTG